MKTREEIAIETSTTITEMKNQLAADNNVSQTDIDNGKYIIVEDIRASKVVLTLYKKIDKVKADIEMQIVKSNVVKG